MRLPTGLSLALCLATRVSVQRREGKRQGAKGELYQVGYWETLSFGSDAAPSLGTWGRIPGPYLDTGESRLQRGEGMKRIRSPFPGGGARTACWVGAAWPVRRQEPSGPAPGSQEDKSKGTSTRRPSSSRICSSAPARPPQALQKQEGGEGTGTGGGVPKGGPGGGPRGAAGSVFPPSLSLKACDGLPGRRGTTYPMRSVVG